MDHIKQNVRMNFNSQLIQNIFRLRAKAHLTSYSPILPLKAIKIQAAEQVIVFTLA